ncbi:hypothetical protein DFH09DRAFT_1440694 [Mycena vulgaris]|nr:hypothetical protein DFH09DRAFT_1440694 [Mycena vulgaris]
MMPLPNAESVKSTPAHSTVAKTSRGADTASTALEHALKILETLGAVAEDIPYLSIITGGIQKLITIQKTIKENRKRADDLLTNIGEVSRVVAEGLHDHTAARDLNDDLQRYQIVLNETHDILTEWMSKHFVKRLWAHRDFAGIADVDVLAPELSFVNVQVARLFALSTGQDILHHKIHEFTNPVYIVLDALDECSDRQKLLDGIKKIVEAKIIDVHLLLTSRPEVPHGSRLDEHVVSLSLELESMNHDIESYIDEILSHMEDD